MPPPALLLRPPIVIALATVVMGLLLGMLLAWTWAIGRLWAGQELLPSKAPLVVPWGGGSVLAGLFAVISVSIGVSATYGAVTGRGSKYSQQDLMLVSALINSTLLVVMPLILRGTARVRAEDFGLAWNRLRQDASAGFVAFLLIAPIIYGVQVVAVQIWKRNEHPVELMMLENLTGRVAILAIVSAVFLAPAVEELLFRGLLQGWLTRRFLGKSTGPYPFLSDIQEWIPDDSPTEPPGGQTQTRLFPSITNPYAAPETEINQADTRSRVFPRVPDPMRSALPILLTSSVFALVHIPQWPAPLAIFLLSLGLGLVYQRTGSLVASFVLHAAFNGLSTLALILVALNPAPLPKNAAPLPPHADTGGIAEPDGPTRRPGQGGLHHRHSPGNFGVFSWTQLYVTDKVL